MDILTNYIDNILVPFLMIHGATMLLTILCLVLTLNFISSFRHNENYYEEEDPEFFGSNIESLRDYIESVDVSANSFKTIQSIVLPKKGDYVEIREGRWQGYVGRITNILDESNYSVYNINVSKKDNFSFGSDIPPFLLKNRSRDYFTVLTDKEISDYNLLSEDEEIDRAMITEY